MPRRPRIATGGILYHVLNLAMGKSEIFADDDDYLAIKRDISAAGMTKGWND